MQARTLTSIFVLSVAATGLGATPGLTDQGYCRHIGGGVVTNFLQPADCAASFQSLCTNGVATGDLRGSVGVSVLGIAGNVYHVHHHWVTESGDTIFLKDAYLTTYPSSDPNNRVLADYLKGIDIIGGTGGFANATGHLSSGFGGIDLSQGQNNLSLRRNRLPRAGETRVSLQDQTQCGDRGQRPRGQRQMSTMFTITR